MSFACGVAPQQTVCPLKRGAFWGLLAALFSISAVAAESISRPHAYRIDQWKSDEGLPQSSVTSLIQTRDGYLWLGTFGGLARFDGVQFKVFDANNSPGLPSSRILLLFEDRAGTLWIATEEGHLVNYAGGVFRAFVPPSRGTLFRQIEALAESPEGVLWMSTAEGQVIRFSEGSFTVISTNWDLSGSRITGLATDVSGGLWVSTEKELAVWQGSAFVVVWDQTREENFGVDALCAGRGGGLWVAGNNRLRKFERGKWVADLGDYRWSKGVVSCLREDRRGQVWVGTYGSSLFRYSGNGAVLAFSRKDGFPGASIRSVHEDREKNIWVGMEGQGLARLKLTVFGSYGRQQGLSGNSVLSVCESEDGALWIGTNGDGINRLKGDTIQHYGPKQGLTNECVWSLVEDRDKTLWAGTWGGGLFKLEGETFVRFENTGADIVCGLHEDTRGHLWLGQQRSDPVVVRLCEGQPVELRLPTQAPHANVRVMAEDATGNIWIGTHDDGLYRVSGDQVTRFGARDGLSSERIRSLYADADGVLWIGTSLGGLNRFEAGKFVAFTTREGLPDNVILHIEEDRRGNLWCSSGGGVFRVSKTDLGRFAKGEISRIRSFNYTKADGLPSLECSGGSQPAGCKTRDGRLWFPTVNGLAVVDPENIPFNALPPPVVIESVRLEGKTRVARDVAQTAPGETSRLTIPPGQNRFEFHYTALSFTAPEKVRFKYKLEGLESDWLDAGTRRSAVYSYLQPGKYQFRVMACNNDGVWNEAGASLAVIVLPQYWQTWWFSAVVVLTVFLLLVGAYEARLVAERKLSRLRLRIARDLHDEVGSNVGSIALLSEVASRQGNGQAEEVSEIRRIAVQTVDSLRDIVWFLDPAGDNMGDLILRMKDTANSMLHGIPFQFRSTGSSAATVPPLELRRNILPIFKEILYNIAKHSQATKVEILVELTSGQFRLWVKDDGVGFDTSQITTGNGLRNLRRRASEMRGEAHLESRPGCGTGVTLLVPITRTRGMRGPRSVLRWPRIPGTRSKRIHDEAESR